MLRVVATEAGLDLVMDPGGGAFYGPKISVQVCDVIGRTWQMSTIQVDFQLPQRFDLHDVGADNERHRPIMIHRGLFGSGSASSQCCSSTTPALPHWLAPVQVAARPVADRHHDDAWEVEGRLREEKLRVEVLDADNDTLGPCPAAKTDKIRTPCRRRRRRDPPQRGGEGAAVPTYPSAASRSRTSSAGSRARSTSVDEPGRERGADERSARPAVAERGPSGPASAESGRSVSLERLWAGWRSSYIESIETAPLSGRLPVLRAARARRRRGDDPRAAGALVRGDERDP